MVNSCKTNYIEDCIIGKWQSIDNSNLELKFDKKFLYEKHVGVHDDIFNYKIECYNNKEFKYCDCILNTWSNPTDSNNYYIEYIDSLTLKLFTKKGNFDEYKKIGE